MSRYTIDPDASHLEVHASSSLHGIDTKANGLEGSIEVTVVDGVMDLAAPVAAEVRFPLEQLRSGNPLYDRETERRIDVKRFPEVVLTLTSAAATDDAGRVDVAGTLALHGVTREVDGEVSVTVGDDGLLTIDGEQRFDVRDWDIKPPKLGLIKVHPDIRVVLHVVARPVEAWPD